MEHNTQDLLAIASLFQLDGKAVSVTPYGEGHINRTYRVLTDLGADYILQKINHHIFPDVAGLMENIVSVTSFLRRKESDPRRVLLPELWPGMISGFILSVTLSIDDFAVTLFTKGSSSIDTLSTYIYADARKGGLTPELRPLFTLIFIVILILLIISNVRASKQTKK